MKGLWKWSFCLMAALQILLSCPHLARAACGSPDERPPFLASGVTPNLLLMIDNSASMYDLAYLDEANQEYCYDDTYDSSSAYAGYFEADNWYAYNLSSNVFEQKTTAEAAALCGAATYTNSDVCVSVDGVPSLTAFTAKGNFLNWAAASKFDLEKKVLTGGKYDSTNARLVMESRGCLGRRFAKKVALTDAASATYYLTLGVRPPDDDEKSDASDNTTRIEVYSITSTGFDNSACQLAIEEMAKASPNQGQLKGYIDDCMGYSSGGGSSLATDSHAAFNHSIHGCWYQAKHGAWPPGAGTVNSVKNDCEKVYGYGVDPEDITPDDRAYVCFGVYGSSPPYGYVGRCWEPASSGTPRVCVDKPCSGEPASGANPRCTGGVVEECSGNYNAKKDTCNKPWVVVQVCTGGGSGAAAGWTDDDPTDPLADLCVEQALQDYCGVLTVPEVIDPSDEEGVTGEFWNIPAVLIDSGVLAQLDEPLAVLKGYIDKAAAPEGLLQEFSDSLRMGAITFNSEGSKSECAEADPYVLYNCSDSDNRDGGQVISYIDDGAAHISSLVSAVNDITATSWTPLAETMFNAIGYYTQNSSLRLDSDDFLIDGSHDPVTAYCQDNNILLITEGGSTADSNSTVGSFAAVAGQNDGDSDDQDSCGDLSGSTLLDDLTYYAKNGSGIYPVESFSSAKNNISTYIVATGTLRNTGSDECSPDNLLEDAAANGGSSLYTAETPSLLEDKLREAFATISSRASSGAAASVISASRGGEGAIYQAIFWPSTTGSSGDPVKWTGEVHGLFVDAYGDMYEDTNSNRTMDDSDNKVVFYFDENDSETKVCNDSLNASGGCDNPMGLNEVHYLWSAAEWLSDIQASDILDNRTSGQYISNVRKRYIFTWEDLDNDGVVDGNEVLPFVERGDWLSAPLTVSGGRGPVPLDFGVTTSAEVDEIVNWIRGQDQSGMRAREITADLDLDGIDTTVTWRLGDVIHSTPTAVAGPSEGYHYLYRDSSYASFVDHYKTRRIVIYFGGNDGMMHAVNGGFYDSANKRFCRTSSCDDEGLTAMTSPELGAELWAYVPYNLLAHLKCLTDPDYDHKYFVDLRPRIFDVRIFDSTDGIHTEGWGTILVGGMRFGGTKVDPGGLDLDEDGAADYSSDNREFTSAYFILDITNPEAPPTLLGEMTRTTGGTEAEMGYTVAVPTVVPMKDGSGSDWYLVFGSGPTSLIGESNQQAALGVLPLKNLTDTPPKAFRIPDQTPTTASDEAGRFQLADSNSFISEPVAVDFDLEQNYMADVLYFGTVQGAYGSWGGKLYRLVTYKEDANGDQEKTTPSQWASLLSPNPLPLLDAGQPITAAPAIGWDGKNYWVYVGSGRFFNADDKTDSSSNAQQTFYGIKEPQAWTDANCDGAFTWETVEKTGTHDSIPGSQGLLQVDQILVQDATTAAAASLSCQDGTTSCLPSGVSTFDKLIDYIAGTGTGCGANDSTGTDGWYVDFLDARERNLGQATLLGGILTFTTYQPYSDVCLSEGLGNLYGLYYQTGTAWHEVVFGNNLGGLDNGNVVAEISLGRGLALTPNLHVGKQEGGTAFVQTSTGTIVKIPEPDLPLKNVHTGTSSWNEITP